MGSQQIIDEEDRRQCWVCFATDEDDATAPWVRPCNCRGTTKWVHQVCLQRWIDEKQRGNTLTAVRCPQCGAQYVILFPDMGSFVATLDTIYSYYCRTCPLLAAGILLGSLYWSAVSYGAVTIMQVVGYETAMAAMSEAEPLLLLVGLPAIPVGLLIGKMLRWEDVAVRCIHQSVSRVPALSTWLSVPAASRDDAVTSAQDASRVEDAASATRVVCSALLFPSVAALAGRLLYDGVTSRLQRTLLGAVTVIVASGALKIFHKHKRMVRLGMRQVLDYDDSRAVAMRLTEITGNATRTESNTNNMNSSASRDGNSSIVNSAADGADNE